MLACLPVHYVHRCRSRVPGKQTTGGEVVGAGLHSKAGRTCGWPSDWFPLRVYTLLPSAIGWGSHRVYALPHDAHPLLRGAHLEEGGARFEDVVKVLVV
eukprot:3465223-Pyramimonas_sp.AAC.1